MIIGLTIFFLTLSADLATDYRLWLKYRDVVKPEGSVKHTIGALLRIIALAGAVWFLGWWSIPAVLFVYWVLFDGIFNVFTDENWFRIGTTAKLDILQRKYPALVWCKYIGCVGSILLYIKAS